MEQKAFGVCASLLVDPGTPVNLTIVNTPYTGLFVRALGGDIELNSVVFRSEIPTAVLAVAAPSVVKETDITLTQGEELGCMRSCTIAGGTGLAQVLFFNN